MKFSVTLMDPFGTVCGQGEITMFADSVRGELTSTDLRGYIEQVTGEQYVQRARMAWYIKLAEIS